MATLARQARIRPSQRRRLAALFFTAALLAPHTDIAALDINMIFDEAGSDQPSFDPNGTRLEQIMLAAALIWEDIIEDPGTVSIDFRYTNISALGFASITEYTLAGQPKAGTIDFDWIGNGQVETNWWFDPTPFSNSEFALSTTTYGELPPTKQAEQFIGTVPDPFEVKFTGAPIPSGPASGKIDILSLALHEIGHVLGLAPGLAAAEIFEDEERDFDVDPRFVGGASMGIRPHGSSTGTDSDIDPNHTAARGLMYPNIPSRTLPGATDVFAVASASAWKEIDLPRKYFLAGPSWNVETSWLGGRLPDISDQALIVHGGSVFVGGGDLVDPDFAEVGSVTVDNNSALQVADPSFSLLVGTLLVNDGAVNVFNSSFASTTDVIVGNNNSFGAELNVRDAGSIFSVSSDLIVEVGTLTIETGGHLIGQSDARVGAHNGFATVNVHDPGSSLEISGDISFATGGGNNLNIENGGKVMADSLFVSTEESTLASVTVRDSGSSLSLTDPTGGLAIAIRDRTIMSVSNGASVTSAGFISIGSTSNAVGDLTVTGTGSTLHGDGDLFVGFSGVGNLLIEDGAAASTDGAATVGVENPGDGSVQVVGPGSTLTVANNLTVGERGVGTLDILEGGRVTAASLLSSFQTHTAGNISVADPGSALNLTDPNGGLAVGVRDRSVLTIENGASVTSAGYVSLGSEATAQGFVLLEDRGSTLHADGDFFVGFSGFSYLIITDGADASADGAVTIGVVRSDPSENLSDGLVSVIGAGSTLSVGTELIVGKAGRGDLGASSGGRITAASMSSSTEVGSTGNLGIGNPGSVLTLTDPDGGLNIAVAGRSLFVIRDGATVTTEGFVTVAATATANGTILLFDPGSTLNVGTDLTIADQGVGELTIRSDAHVNADTTAIGPNGTVTLDGGRLTTTHLTIDPAATFDLLDGTLTADTIDGDVTQQGGTIEPGNSPGTTDILGAYTITAGSIHIEIQPPATATPTPGADHDLVTVTGNVALGGTLDIELINSFENTIIPTDRFTVMTWATNTGNTAFASTNTNAPSIPGLTFTPTYNPTNLMITATALDGDADLDGDVDLDDLVILAANFDTAVTARDWRLANFDFDSDVDGDDLNLMAVNFSGPTDTLTAIAAALGVSITQTPEPTAGAVLVVSMIGLVRGRSRVRGYACQV